MSGKWVWGERGGVTWCEASAKEHKDVARRRNYVYVVNSGRVKSSTRFGHNQPLSPFIRNDLIWKLSKDTIQFFADPHLLCFWLLEEVNLFMVSCFIYHELTSGWDDQEEKNISLDGFGWCWSPADAEFERNIPIFFWGKPEAPLCRIQVKVVWPTIELH